ncbi:ABC transporter permease [Carnobacterium funditum]|uniref:ABC transporter permease n=1 Tax=Carnobacterium funditum TaxID=2752 RepID=UPI000AC54A09|nr:ABC transporter permease [Carnobacterium funditum]
MTIKKKNGIYLLFLLPFMVLIILFEIFPLLSILINSVSPIGTSGFTLTHFTSIFASDYYRMSIFNSLMIAVWSSVIGLSVAVLGAYAIHHATPKVKRFFINLINMASNFQGIQLAFAFIILLGNAGVLVLIGQQMNINFLANFDVYSSTGILMTFIYFQIPLATLLLYPSFDAIHQEYKEAAMLLNASKFSFWMRVGIPIVLPSLFGTFSVLFSNALAAYATPYALMGNNYALLPIRISAMFTGDVVQQVELGSALSVILLLLMSVMTVISTNVLKKMKKEG